MDTGPTSSYQHRQDGLVITAVVMTVIALTFVMMRSASRFIVIRNPGLDDYFMLAAMTLTISYVVMLFILRENRVGFPMSKLSPDNMVAFFKTTLAIQVLYYTNVFCIKTSIVLTYLRFAVTHTFRRLCYGTVALHAVFYFICLVVTLSQCRPLGKMWDLSGSSSGSCINTTAFFYSTSAFNIITDLWILVLPYRTLREIQRPRRERVALLLIFGVGAFAAAASIVRLHTIYIYTLSPDPFRDGIPVNLWSVIEVTVAISCASVPALKPVFSRKQRAATRAAKSSLSSPTTTYGSGSARPQHWQAQTQMYYSYEPPQAYEARQVYIEAQEEREQQQQQEKESDVGLVPTANLAFYPPDPKVTRPSVDREQTESSGVSLGLPLQRPLQQPPLQAPRPPVPIAFSAARPDSPGRMSSQVSVFQNRPRTQTQTPSQSQTQSQNQEPGKRQNQQQAVLRRSSSPPSLSGPRARPGPLSRTASHKSVTFDDGWPLPAGTGAGAGVQPKGTTMHGNGS